MTKKLMICHEDYIWLSGLHTEQNIICIPLSLIQNLIFLKEKLMKWENKIIDWVLYLSLKKLCQLENFLLPGIKFWWITCCAM